MSHTPKGRFPKSAHLRKHSDFSRVYQQGRRHFSGNMTVFYLPGPVPEGAAAEGGDAQNTSGGGLDARVRIGFTVPRSLGGAVDRNRMRRRTREAVRHHLLLLERIPGRLDVVINPKKSLLVAEFSQISREIERAFGVIRRACEAPGGGIPTRSSRGQRRRGGRPCER